MPKKKLKTASRKKQSHMTPQQIINKTNREKRVASLRKELREKYLEAFSEEGELLKVDYEDIVGKKVKLDVERYEKWFDRDKGKVSKKFIDWFYENKYREFIVESKAHDDTLAPYTLEGVDYWTFTFYDLLEVK